MTAQSQTLSNIINGISKQYKKQNDREQRQKKGGKKETKKKEKIQSLEREQVQCVLGEM
jgi:hypothetical protein